MTVDERYRARARGRAAECLVEADLLRRGLEVTRPSVDNGDDLHARFEIGWRSIQVKTKARGSWTPRNDKYRNHSGVKVLRRIPQSSLCAVVEVSSGGIRYSLRNQEDVMPVELL